MNKIAPEPGEMRATISIKRQATGKTETFEMIGHVDPEKLQQILAARRAAITPKEK